MSRHLGRTVLPKEICVNHNCRSLTDYLEKFRLPIECLHTPKHIQEESYHFLKSMECDKIEYIEVRFAPLLCVTPIMSCTEVIENVLLGLEKAKNETGINFGLITCAMRSLSEDDNMYMPHCAAKYLGRGICGVDLAGDESRYPNEQFLDFFRKAKRQCIPLTVHSGETGNTKNVYLAMEHGARRIGHGRVSTLTTALSAIRI